MSLFDGENDPRADLETLITATRDALASTEYDARFLSLFPLVNDGMAWRLVGHLRARRLPPAALALAGGAAAVGVGKPYAVRPAWDAALALRRGPPPQRAVRALPELESQIEELHARMRDGDGTNFDRDEDLLSLACAERWVAELLAMRTGTESPGERASIEALLEDARWDLAETVGRGASRTDPALVRVADRVAPIGAGGSSLSTCAEDRVVLYEGRKHGPAWEGLRLAIDACAGGSHAAVDALGSFARAHAALGWPLWLDEVACAFAGHPRRDASARSLDVHLASDLFGARQLAWYRSKLDASLGPARDAWLTLATRRDQRFGPPGEFADTISDERARLDAGLPGRLDREVFRMIERTLEESNREARREEERTGPFFDLRIDPPLERTFDSPLFYLFIGFRTLYGTELAREALVALAN